MTAKEISIAADDDDGAPLATVDRTNWLSASLGRFRQRKVGVISRSVTDRRLVTLGGSSGDPIPI